MTVATTTGLMTSEEFLAMRDDGIERELVRGVVKVLGERGTMTRRSRKHTRVVANVSHVLREWLLTQPVPRGEILSGEAAFQLSPDFDSNVGIDLAYVSAELASASAQRRAGQFQYAARIDGRATFAGLSD